MSGALACGRHPSTITSQPDAVIEIAGLVKRYGSFIAVDSVDLTVIRNEIFGILGPNGAGKTTTLEMVEGLRRPDSGTIRVAGIDVVANPTAVKRVIGVQLQTTALFDYLTAWELIELFAALCGGDTSRRRVDELVSMVALEEKSGSHVNQLSGGQRQRLSIALSIVNDPEVLFLDEPTTGLDPQARRNLWDLIRELRDAGKTVVMTTHYMEEAEALCDRVAVMDRGRIIAVDTPRSLIQSLGESATIRARIDGDVDASLIAALPGALGAEFIGGQLTVHTEDVPATLMALLLFAEERRMRLENLASERATLEDVFLAFTGRSLRE
ncbi:MAG TPA: ATP-binding cassette domain-containing protein [Thermomicrobiales bacterium]|nr:ATP-binding cassette domain-containing protein [Thermomicrobiales bacterium]